MKLLLLIIDYGLIWNYSFLLNFVIHNDFSKRLDADQIIMFLLIVTAIVFFHNFKKYYEDNR
jgi:hypothetical protein